MANTYDAIVIGGGHNGLCAGAYLAKSGANTIVLEKRYKTGGAADTSTPWPEHPDLKVTTYSYVSGLIPPSVVKELQLERHGYKIFPMGPVYQAYDRPDRLWGIDVIDDQQLAGAIMKMAGGLYLWGIVIYIFATKFAANQGDDYDFKRKGRIPTAEITGHDELPLTTEDVERAFADSAPPSDH